MEARIRRALEARFGDEELARRAELTNMGGHASLRIYWRVALPDGDDTLIAMVLPEGFDLSSSDEGTSGTDAQSQELPFVEVQRYLGEALEMPVPRIELVDMELGVLLLEDLGDETFERRYLELVGAGEELVEAHYRRAIDLLVRLQIAAEAVEVEARQPQTCVAWGRRFDEELLRWELDHFTEWGLQAQRDEAEVGRWEPVLTRAWERIVAALLALPTTLVLRDYQSRNIMLAPPDERFVLIDFQDALVGPFIYDLVALLRDSYIALPPTLVDRLVSYYQRQGMAAGLAFCTDEAIVRRAFRLQTLQRKLKDAGRFIFIDRVKGNPSFLDYFDPTMGYVQQALAPLAEEDEVFAELQRALQALEVFPDTRLGAANDDS